MKPRGSGFVGHHGDDFLLANNAQWIGFSMEIGPAGDVYVLDWHDADICGKEVLNKQTGRVFRIGSNEVKPDDWEGRYEDLNGFTDRQLVDLQTSPSAWHARRARVILQHRANLAQQDAGEFDAEQAKQSLVELLRNHPNTDHRLRALWSLHVTGLINEIELQGLLDDPEPYVRGWAIQLLCEDRNPPTPALNKFEAMAKQDPSPVVRLYLAAALQRMEAALRWPILNQLALHGEDADDHNLPKMLWFGLEPLVSQYPEQAIQLAFHTQIPLLARHTARRLSDADQTELLIAAVGKNPDRSEVILKGLRDSLEGQFNEPAPAGWTAVAKQLEAAGGESARIALELSQQFGDQAAAEKMLATLRDQNSGLESKQAAIRALAGQRHPALPPILMELLNDRSLRIDVIRAMASFNERQFTRELLNRYSRFSDEEKQEAVQTLASRSESGKQLTAAIQRGDVPRRDIPAYVARVLRRVVGQSFIDVWGPIDGVSVAEEAAFARYRRLLTAEAIQAADTKHGREVYKKACAVCHKLYNEGGEIGPDITGANRPSLDYLLSNILTPSAEIQDAYKMQIILTDDGRIYSGIPAEENERQLKLRIANQDEPVTIAKAEIESRQMASVSMMPNGLLKQLTEAEIKDLFAYLQTSGPLTESQE